MHAPTIFFSVLAFAASGKVVHARDTGTSFESRRLAARQTTDILVKTDSGEELFSFEPFPAEAKRRDLERRNAFGVVLGGVRDLIVALNAEDLEKRERLTKEVVSRLAIENPGDMIVTTNVDFSFTNGEILEQDTIVYSAIIGADVTYEVLRFRSGTFVLQGDGGFINWAYATTNAACTGNGGTVSCP